MDKNEIDLTKQDPNKVTTPRQRKVADQTCLLDGNKESSATVATWPVIARDARQPGETGTFEEPQMYRDKPKIDRASIARTTHAVASYVRALIERAEAMDKDEDYKIRMEVVSECVYCYVPYGAGRIGGTTTTHRECGLCSTIIYSGSKNCDVLCVECARKNGLCKHCGADVDLNEEVENNGDSPTGEGTRS